MAAIVRKATGSVEEVGGPSVKRLKGKRGREGTGAREGRECVV